MGRDERGATLVLVAAALVVLFGVAAIAVDLSALRSDRSADQKVVDSAAAAGALAALSGGGEEACEAALSYAAINAEDIASVDTSGCVSAFAASCDPAVPVSRTVSAGRYSITVTSPVVDADPLMTSSALGAPTQAVVTEDGSPCERVGVTMTADHQSFFAQVIGMAGATSSVHAVAVARLPDGDGVPLNLLVLDRTGCQAIDVQGQGGIVVSAVVNEDGTGLHHGVAASDSDGSAGCFTDGVIDLDGSDSVIRADGPAGCLNQVGTSTVGGFLAGHGCGLVQALAPGTPGCNPPACTQGGAGNVPNPQPTALPARLTRFPIDHRYNCWFNYSTPPATTTWAADPLTSANQQEIAGCSAGTGAHVYDLIELVGQNGPVGGFTNWNQTLGHSCDLGSDPTPIVVSGNVRIDCADFIIRREVRITGNVVFDGNVNVTSSTGHLNVRNTAGSPGWAFFRGGTMTKDGQAHLTFDGTAVYMAKGSRVRMAGGTGSLTWVAPDSGDFDDLALWSDSSLLQEWAGQANLVMEGVFFTPWAAADYSGTSGQNQTDAQWVAFRLTARGQGQLVIAPAVGRSVEFPISPRTTLIR